MKNVSLLAVGALTGAVLSVGAVVLVDGMTNHGADQPYADEQGRMISSLSAEDVADLTAGRGWGLAKPAEFNGYPGPAHVIEFADGLDLTVEQREAVDASFGAMQAEARRLGLDLIEAEKALDAAFVDGSVDGEKLAALLASAGDIRSRLREAHLAAHLEVAPLLSTAQKARYAELRGYHGGHGGH